MKPLDGLDQLGFAVLPKLAADARIPIERLWDSVAHLHAGGFSATIMLADTHVRRSVHMTLAPALAQLTRLLSAWRPVVCGFANKDAGSHAPMPPHQDITLVDETAGSALSLWMPMLDVGSSNGCLRVVPGSHRLNSAPRAPGTPFAAQYLEDRLRAHHSVELALEAWQPVVIDQRLFHESGSNVSDASRPVVTAALIPADQPLRYYHRTMGDAGAVLEGFMVPDDFLLDHRLGCRPERGICFGAWPERSDIISMEMLSTLPSTFISQQTTG